jgi:ligand-binding sensor domain-containing protein/signal transduction histidine kinase/DNA-binding response OmpR family regulator
MIAKRFIVVIMLMCSFFLCGEAADYHFIHYNKENSGLSYNGIRVMKQDSRGFVWVGTHKGLCRYDGKRFKNYDRNDFKVDSDFITALEEDGNGNIWIGTDKGIVIYDYASDSFRTFADLFGVKDFNDRIFSIKPDSKGNMWIGSRSSGLFKCDLGKKTARRVPVLDESGRPVVNFYRMTFDKNDRLWIAVYCDNIYFLDSTSNAIVKLRISGSPDFFHSDDVEGVAVDSKSDNVLYVASKKHGLCVVDAKNGTVRSLLTLSGEHRPTNLETSSGKYLWLSSTEGLFQYDLQTGENRLFRNSPNDRFSLSDNYITTSFVDTKGGLWVGTFNGGVNYYGSFQNNFNKYYMTSDGEPLNGCVVRSFAEDAFGVIWIATEQAGLLRLGNDGSLRKWSSPQIPHNITALCSDGPFVWVGTQNGICRFSPPNGKVQVYTQFENAKPVSDNRVVTFYLAADGTLYVATAVGVLRYNRVDDRFYLIDRLEDLTIENMVEDARGKIWMASYSNGVFAYDPAIDSLTHYCIRNGNSVIPEMTSSMCVDGNGGVWTVGFSSGFFKYDRVRDAFDAINKSRLSSLPTDVYFSAAPDANGNLWLSSDSGLVKYNPENGLIKVFTLDDGLLDMDFKKSVLTLSNGNLLFGSENGFIRFDPESFNAEPGIVSVAITDMTAGGVSKSPGNGKSTNIDIADEIHFSPSENSFTFSFATPDVPTPAYGRILCRLDGFESSWRDVSTTKVVSFYDVPAGKYHLQVKTVANDGNSHSGHKDVLIVVEPKFWESPFGIVTMILALLILAGLVFRYFYVKAVNEEKRKQEAYEKERDAELYNDKITFFSNIMHEIKTPLTLIKTPLQKIMSSENLGGDVTEDLEVIKNSSEYMDGLVKELLEFVRVEKHGYDLDIKTIDIVEKLGFLCFNFAETAKAKNVCLTYRHDEDCIYIEADESALNKMLNNLLHNAVKYAESVIDVHVYQENEQVTVSIRNDGPTIPEARRESIFKPFVSYGSTPDSQSQSFGIGLSLAKKFAEMHNGTLFLDSDPTCTKFVLRMPSRVGEKTLYKSPEINIDEYVKSSTNPLIVLVEDNKDLSSYLKRKLEKDFRVIAVPSAEQALALLKKYNVDMLITDIVLENMSGVELCKKVSSDFEISHIPVVVVSAISSVDTKIQCMDNGASIYIEKPFSLDYLESCIRNIIDKRANMRTAVNANGIENVDAAKYDLPDLDEEFLRRLDAVVLENLQNGDFSNKQLEEKLFMSHSTLNRKVKALLDTTPNDYIRKKRLSVAAHMLETGERRINEICWAVGFTPSYFSKCFKEQYGLLPMEYRAKFFRKE